MSNPDVFQAYSQYYDLLYRDKDYESEVAYVDSLLRRYEIPGKDLLELGCGTGRHARRLSELGYQILGLERSSRMVEAAQQTAAFQCLVGDACTSRLGRTFSAVLALFHVVSYQVSNSSLRALFERSAEHLQKGGLFVFDVWYSPAVYANKPEPRIKTVSDEQIRVHRIAEPQIYPSENRVDVHYTIMVEDRHQGQLTSFQEVHPMRHFSLPELELLAQLCGFESLGAEEFLTGRTPSEDTWGVCLVFRKL
ncbi:MAG: hypothetical protein RLZZ399_488 [Verrucomicrobiota bacterium]|jgi:SAM-dependent methyltransferase